MSLPTEKNDRKEMPLARGCLDYFPDALAEVAHVSFVGNQQHNPGEPLHWAREKSTDHADCVARHLIERGTIDTDGLRHTAKIAWRALAMLQEELESTTIERFPQNDPYTRPYIEPEPTNRKLRDNRPVPPTIEGSDTPVGYFSTPYQIDAWNALIVLGCDPDVANHITRGMSCGVKPGYASRYVYLAGPMRGHEKFNFPAFDSARDKLLLKGWNVVSPADIDRAAGIGDVDDPKPFVYRDLFALLLVASHKGSIAMLPGWEKSTGATAEFFLARWLGLEIRSAGTSSLLRYCDVNYPRVQEALSKSLPGDV